MTHEEKQRAIWDEFQSQYPYQLRRPRRRSNSLMDKASKNNVLCCEVNPVFTNWGFETFDDYKIFNDKFPTNPLEQLHFHLLHGQSVWWVTKDQRYAKSLFDEFVHKYSRKDRVSSKLQLAIMQEDPMRRQTQAAPHIRFVSQSTHAHSVLGTHAIVHISVEVPKGDFNSNRKDWENVKVPQEVFRLPL